MDEHPAADVHVYAVWFEVLGGDAKSEWDPDVMPDPRVTHLWDVEPVTPFWFAENVDQTAGFVWDTYLLYGADATWDEIPAPLVDVGATVIERRERLRASILPLLQGAPAAP